MKYLSYEGLQYLAGQIKEYIESKVFKRNFESTSSEAKSASGDGVTYFTSDTKQIMKDGIAYGGSITAEDVSVVQEGGITVQAVIFVQNYTSNSNSSFTIKPNYKYIFGERSALTISLEPVTDSSIVNHYMFEFVSGSTATTLSLPSSIKWTTEPSIKPNKTYQISIENNLGVIQEWE